MWKKYLLIIAIPGYKLSVENVELSSPIQHNDSPEKNSRTTVTVSFLDVTGIKPDPDLSSNQNTLRITSGTESTLIRKEDTTPLISCPFFDISAPLQTVESVDDILVIPCSCRLWAATTNLSNNSTLGLELFPSARNDTIVDSELCSYTDDSTPVLQISDHSSTCEVVQQEVFDRFWVRKIVSSKQQCNTLSDDKDGRCVMPMAALCSEGMELNVKK
ncbi:uncharacterized protein TNCV_3511201 [Trichonephila clavipes]|nr:uncharacterized protein TNCV_3511201 [Trichonephila clavipes]